MSITQMRVSPELRRVGRRSGYTIAVVLNLAMLIVTVNILDWGWMSFLTYEFAGVVPWIVFSLVASIMVNLIYQFNDTTAVKSTGQILTNLIGVFVTVEIWQVFPFDFSPYAFDWELVVRIVLILAVIGSGIGVITEVLKLASVEAGKRTRVLG